GIRRCSEAAPSTRRAYALHPTTPGADARGGYQKADSSDRHSRRRPLAKRGVRAPRRGAAHLHPNLRCSRPIRRRNCALGSTTKRATRYKVRRLMAATSRSPRNIGRRRRGGSHPRQMQSTAPERLAVVDEGLQVEKLAPGGEGFGRRANGEPVFVPGGLPGDEVTLRQLRVERGYSRATEWTL